jgi:hypothetical protein
VRSLHVVVGLRISILLGHASSNRGKKKVLKKMSAEKKNESAGKKMSAEKKGSAEKKLVLKKK